MSGGPLSVPKFDELFVPVLTRLARANGGVAKRGLSDGLIVDLGLTDVALAERIPSGQSTWDNRLGWACSYLKRVGWIQAPKRAFYEITAAGRSRLSEPNPITLAEVRPLLIDGGGEGSEVDRIEQQDLTPEERIHAALNEIRADLAERLLVRLHAASPRFFEQTVLRLLEKMGYAGELGGSEHAGKTGDGGVDGVLYLDRLHLERVYVQAKRWQGSVSASVVRDFAGAMDGESATKGVILTTSTFTKDAHRYLEKSPKAIRLVGGEELAALMVEFGVGVSRSDTFVIPKEDGDFFEEA
jgi:restriction system protein